MEERAFFEAFMESLDLLKNKIKTVVITLKTFYL